MADTEKTLAERLLDIRGTTTTETGEEPSLAERLQAMRGSGSTSEEAPIDPELQALLDRNPQIKLTGEDIQDDRVPISGTLSYDVTEQVRASRDPVRDYQYYYGDRPEGAGYWTSKGAMVGDVSDAITETFTGERPEPNDIQLERDAQNAIRDEWLTKMQELYDNAPTADELGLDVPAADGGGDVKVDAYLETDADGNLVVGYTRIPDPRSTATQRVIDQAGRNIYQQLGGLFTEGAIMSESELERRVPDFEQGGLEGLMTDIVTFGAPGMLADKLGRNSVRAIGAARAVDMGTKGFRAAEVLGASIGAALSDMVMSTEGDQGMVFTPEAVSNIFKIEDGEAAQSIAMFVDGMVLNGVFDSILYVGGKALRMGANKVGGLRSYIDPDYVQTAAERQALLGVMTLIDPTLEGMETRKLTSNLRSLAALMGSKEYTEALLTIGETTAKVPLDTVNTMANAAAKYIEVTRSDLRRGMSDTEWVDYVNREATSMVDRTIAVTRSQDGNAVLRDSMVTMSDSVGKAMLEEADRINPNTAAGQANVQTSAQALVDQRNADIAQAGDNLTAAQQNVDRITTEIGTAVQNDPYIRGLLATNDPLKFFDESNNVEALRTVIGDDLFNEYQNAWKQVNEAYASIPNSPIDTEGFIDAVNAVVQETNILDSSGNRTKAFLGKVYSVLQPQATRVGDDIVMETAEEVLDRVDGAIGFQDLYRVRKEISNMIGTASDPAVRQRLIELKNHITDPDEGQLGFLLKSGDVEAADAALRADRLYIDTMSRFQDAAPLRQYSDLAAERSAGTNTATSERFQPRGQADLDAQSVNNILPSVTSDITGAQYTALRNAFDNPELASKFDAAVIQLYTARGIEQLGRSLQGNTAQTPELIIQAFEDQARVLRQAGSPIAGKLEDAANRIKTLQGDLGSSLTAAEDALDIARQEAEAAQESIVNRLLNPNNPARATSQPTQAINSILTGANAQDNIEALMQQVDRLPEGQREIARGAVQATVLRSLREKIYTNTPISSATGGRGASTDVRLSNVSFITAEQSNSILGGVRAAFPDSPETVAGIEAALEFLQDSSGNTRVRLATVGSPTAVNIGLKESVSTAILFSLGYMNPTAAAARRLTTAQVEAVNEAAKRTSERTVATILANPVEFGRILKAVADKEDPSTLSILRDGFLSVAQEGIRYDLRVNGQSEIAYGIQDEVMEAIQRSSENEDTPEGFEN